VREFYRTALRPSVVSFGATADSDAVHLIKVSTARVPKTVTGTSTIDTTYEQALDVSIDAAQKGQSIADVTPAQFGRVGTLPLVFVPGRYTIMAVKSLRANYKTQTFGSTNTTLTDVQLTSLITSDPDLSDEDHWVPAFV